MTADPPELPTPMPPRPQATPERAPADHAAPTPPPSPPPRASFGQTLNAVLWGFFGVRKRRHLDRDAASLNPVALIVTGVALAAVFVLGLVLLVRFITR